MLINTTCCFTIINSNRKYVKYLFLHYILHDDKYDPFHKNHVTQTPVTSTSRLPSSLKMQHSMRSFQLHVDMENDTTPVSNIEIKF